MFVMNLIGTTVDNVIVFSMIKRRKQNSWFERAAKEMDIELDEKELYLFVIIMIIIYMFGSSRSH